MRGAVRSGDVTVVVPPPTGLTGHSEGDGEGWDCTSGQPGGIVTVNPDGTDVARVRPGTHRMEFYVQRPYRFTDSADSDPVHYENYSGGDVSYGYTGWVTLASGEEAVDAGVCNCP